MKTRVTHNLKVPAEAVWDVFCDLASVANYLPAVSSCNISFSGGETIRTVYLADGTYYEERITGIDHEKKVLCYSIIDPSPFSYNQLKGFISVTAISNEVARYIGTVATGLLTGCVTT